MLHSLLPVYLIGFGVIAGLLLILRLLIAVSGARRQLARLRGLHRNEEGGVQSLSFVLTMPLFIIIMMGIVQASQIMIAQIVVEYAAIAAARSAAVWIPAHIDGTSEGRNRIGLGELQLDRTAPGGVVYKVDMGNENGSPNYPSWKTFRIGMAAAQACASIAPSRDTQSDIGVPGGESLDSLVRAFQSIAPDSESGDAVVRRMRNKLAYCLANTRAEVEVFHPDEEPELKIIYEIPPDTRTWISDTIFFHEPAYVDYYANNRWYYFPRYQEDAEEFHDNEIGWQDEITVIVKHDLALLPGPGRMFSKLLEERGGRPPMQPQDGVYKWPLEARATISSEGQKPILRYEHDDSGRPY